MLDRVSPPPALAATSQEVLRFLRDGIARGRRGVLVTIAGLTRAGPRAVGAHMAVLDGGDYAGSFSGGCVEAAIVAEALATLQEGRARSVRFGEGSRFIDIRLPCGGGMDVLFTPDPPLAVLDGAVARLDGRETVTLSLGPQGEIAIDAEPADHSLQVRHAPPLKLIIIGQGAEALTMVGQAATYGAEVELHSPDEQLLVWAAGEDVAGSSLVSAAAPPELAADRWTAIILLFHDHGWESALLRCALATPAFWIGAMGSSRTQAARLGDLAAQGIPDRDLARVRGPIGLIPEARDPATLALSALAEIVGRYRTLVA